VSRLRLVSLLSLILLALNCKRPAVSPSSEGDRRDLVRKTEKAVEAAGKSQVWFQSPTGSAPGRPETPSEARVGSEAYAAVIAALRHEAEKDGLQFTINQSRTKETWRVADVRLSRQGKLVCRWKLHEVRRILYAAIIIDDLGQNLSSVRQLLALPDSVTFSVLPHLQESVETAHEARRAGREVMLHFPMEPEPGSRISAGKGEIRSGMTEAEIEDILQSDLDSVPAAAGVNNHMGSGATADPRLMAAVMRLLRERHLYFVDSRTTPASVAFSAARREGLPAFYRSVFLDDTETVPYTLGQLRRFRHILEEQGVALAIGHPHPTTITALAQYLPELEQSGVRLVPVSRILRLPEAASLKPPPFRALAR